MKVGGYDAGYRSCEFFWGRSPGSLMSRLDACVGSYDGIVALDAGCGDGRNAVHLASRGAAVHAFDVSPVAIENARRQWPSLERVTWTVADVRHVAPAPSAYGVTLAYGLFHCLADRNDIAAVVGKLVRATRPGGYHVVSAMNRRRTDFGGAHPDFNFCLIDHDDYIQLYSDYDLIYCSDEDLVEAHPHNGIVHTHAMTRLIVRIP